jgi:uncharacterized glyoxalase superfamily protein PhnB
MDALTSVHLMLVHFAHLNHQILYTYTINIARGETSAASGRVRTGHHGTFSAPRALVCGMHPELPPADHSSGDRSAGIKDPFGNIWYIATHVKDDPLA